MQSGSTQKKGANEEASGNVSEMRLHTARIDPEVRQGHEGDLYITTSRLCLDEATLAAHPRSGGLFRHKPINKSEHLPNS